MLSVDEALRIVIEAVAPLDAEERSLAEARGRVLAEDVAARDSNPFAPASAMDGFAVRAAETRGADAVPRRLRLAGGLVAAGAPPERGVAAGEAIPVATGALVPPGADAVVRKEDAAVEGYEVVVRAEVREGENVRLAGEDFRAGDVVLARGTVLGPLALAVAAAAGRPRLRVHRRPRVAVLATGDELIGPDEEMAPGRVRVSSTVGLLAALAEAGAEAVDLGIARDREDEIRERLEFGLSGHDALATTGGVSVGERDLVRPVLETFGFAEKFHGVSVKPGKPLLFGLAGARPVFGLPGNPVSTLVTWEVFVRPAVLKMAGRAAIHRPFVQARLDGEVRRSPGREEYLRAEAVRERNAWRATPVEGQGSHQVRGLARTNALVVVPAETVAVPRGAEVDLMLLEGPETEAWRS